jgi:hypothetical protein
MVVAPMSMSLLLTLGDIESDIEIEADQKECIDTK